MSDHQFDPRLGARFLVDQHDAKSKNDMLPPALGVDSVELDAPGAVELEITSRPTRS